MTNGLSVAVNLDEAAAALGMSRDSFDKYVRPDVKIIYVTERLIVVPVRELTEWVDRNARRALENDG